MRTSTIACLMIASFFLGGETLLFFEGGNSPAERWKAGTPEADNAAVTQTPIEPAPGEVPTRFQLGRNFPMTLLK